jgi:hypothetical protein
MFGTASFSKNTIKKARRVIPTLQQVAHDLAIKGLSAPCMVMIFGTKKAE